MPIPTKPAFSRLTADDYNALVGAINGTSLTWTSYAPSWTAAGVAPSLGNGLREGRYREVQGLILAEVRFAFGSTTTYGTGDWSMGLPVAAAAGEYAQGAGHAYDLGTFYRPFTLRQATASTTFLVFGQGGVGLATNVAPWTWANGDQLFFSVLYQPA